MARPEDRFSLVLRTVLPILFLWMIREQLVPILLAALFALILDPLRRRLERRRFGSHAPAILTAAVVAFVVIPFAGIAARVAVSINAFVAGGLTDVLTKLQAFVSDRISVVRDVIPIENVQAAASSMAQRIASSVAAFAAGIAAALPGRVVDLFLFTLALYYFLRDGARLVGWLGRLSPFEPRDTQTLFASVRDTVHGAIVGQLATSAVQGGLALIALWVFHIPGALLFAVIALLLSVVPLVGTTPVTVGAVVYLLATGRPLAALGMAVAAAVIGVSDNVVRPWVQSAQSNMHPLLTLLAIFGGIELFGASGVFLGPVVAAVAVWAIDLHTRLQARPEGGPTSLRGGS